jgi:hypothetical protein
VNAANVGNTINGGNNYFTTKKNLDHLISIKLQLQMCRLRECVKLLTGNPFSFMTPM